MSYVRDLTNSALNAESELHKRLDDLEATLETEGKLCNVEEAWENAVVDGVIDAGEMSQLEELFVGAGMGDQFDALKSKADPDGAIRGEAVDKAGDLVDAAVGRRRRTVSEGDLKRQLEINYLMNKVQFFYEGASNVSKMQHRAYENCIKNLA